MTQERSYSALDSFLWLRFLRFNLTYFQTLTEEACPFCWKIWLLPAAFKIKSALPPWLKRSCMISSASSVSHSLQPRPPSSQLLQQPSVVLHVLQLLPASHRQLCMAFSAHSTSCKLAHRCFFFKIVEMQIHLAWQRNTVEKEYRGQYRESGILCEQWFESWLQHLRSFSLSAHLGKKQTMA